MSKASSQHIDEKGKNNKLPLLLSGFNNLKLTPNKHLLHLAVLREQSNKRAGTASTKTKSEVRGGGKKQWKEKGTGRARAGSIRSPLWVGGGISFGPKPRSYKSDLPKKAKNLAILQAIATKGESLIVLKKLPEIKDSKTKNFVIAMKTFGAVVEPVLLVCDSKEPHFNEVKRSSNNLKNVTVLEQSFMNVYEILKSNTLIITEKALEELKKRLSKHLKEKAKSA